MRNSKILNSIVSLALLILVSNLISVGCTKRPSGSAQTPNDATTEKLIKSAAAQPTFENYISLGLHFSGLKRSEDAVLSYQKAISLNPNSAVGWNNLCSELNSQRKFVDAIANCEKAVSIAPQFELAQNNLKFAQVEFANLKKWVMDKNKDWTAKSNLTGEELLVVGLDFYAIRELNTAIQAWEKIKSGDSSYSAAQNNLATTFITMKRFDAAEKSLGEALKLEPNNELYANNKQWLERAKAGK